MTFYEAFLEELDKLAIMGKPLGRQYKGIMAKPRELWKHSKTPTRGEEAKFFRRIRRRVTSRGKGSESHRFLKGSREWLQAKSK